MRIEVTVSKEALTNIIIRGSETRMGKSFGTVKNGAEKVKTTPKSPPGQNRSKEKSPKQVEKWEGDQGLQREDSEESIERCAPSSPRPGSKHTRQFLGLGDRRVLLRPLSSILDAVPAG